MLKELIAENFAIIDNIQAEFSSGLSILTGETGAGKSILIDALEMALGKRARSGLIRRGANKLQVSLTFDISNIARAQQWLKQHDFDTVEKNICILRRTYTKDGYSQAYINRSPVTLNQIKELSALIVDIVGQNTHQQLLNKEHQLWLLDVRCDHAKDISKVNSLYQHWKTIDDEITKYNQSSHEKELRKSILKQQIEELEDAQIEKGEYEEVDPKHCLLYTSPSPRDRTRSRMPSSA